jgi:cell division protease FtsH
MSDEIGPLAVLPADGQGPFLPGASEVSSKTQERIDEEVRRIVEDCHREVLALLADNRAKLDALAEALVEHETLDEDDAYAAAGVDHRSSPGMEDLATSASVAAGRND